MDRNANIERAMAEAIESARVAVGAFRLTAIRWAYIGTLKPDGRASKETMRPGAELFLLFGMLAEGRGFPINSKWIAYHIETGTFFEGIDAFGERFQIIRLAGHYVNRFKDMVIHTSLMHPKMRTIMNYIAYSVVEDERRKDWTVLWEDGFYSETRPLINDKMRKAMAKRLEYELFDNVTSYPHHPTQQGNRVEDGSPTRMALEFLSLMSVLRPAHLAYHMLRDVRPFVVCTEAFPSAKTLFIKGRQGRSILSLPNMPFAMASWEDIKVCDPLGDAK